MTHVMWHETQQKLDQIIALLKRKDESKDFLKLKEAAEYIGVEPQTLYHYTSQEKIVFSKPTGRNLRFKKEDLDAWLSQNRSDGNTGPGAGFSNPKKYKS